MKSKRKSALCSKCGKEQISNKVRKLCMKCYKCEWAKEYYHNNKKEMREKAKLWDRKRKRELGKRLPMVDNLWSREYDCCVSCGTTKKEHTDHGLCTICKDKSRYHQKHKKYLEKLYSNKKFHEKELKKFRDRNNKNYINNPAPILKRCKEYYQKNKEEISKKNKLKFAKKRKELRKGKIFFCEECGKKFKPKIILTNYRRFCSYKCSQKNYIKINKKILNAKNKIFRILNNKRIIEKERENRLKTKDKKKESDNKYYNLNYNKIRESSRIREIFRGNLLPFNNKDFEEIMERDISLLKKRIKEKEKEINELNSKSNLIINLVKQNI